MLRLTASMVDQTWMKHVLLSSGSCKSLVDEDMRFWNCKLQEKNTWYHNLPLNSIEDYVPSPPREGTKIIILFPHLKSKLIFHRRNNSRKPPLLNCTEPLSFNRFQLSSNRRTGQERIYAARRVQDAALRNGKSHMRRTAADANAPIGVV